MKVFAVAEGGEGGAIRADLTGDLEELRLGSGGGGFSWTLMHSLSSSPSNIVSMARFLDLVGEREGDRTASEVLGLLVFGVVLVGMVGMCGGEGFPSVWDSASSSSSSSSSVMSLWSNSSDSG